MGKKDKRKQVVEKFPIDAEVANFEARYSSIMPCVDATLVRRLYETSIPNETRQNGVSWNITTNFNVERKFFLAIKELILDGDIDLEIAVIEQFMSIGRMLIRKLGYRESDIDNKVETAITDTIENYLGEEGFKNALLKELKNIVRGKKEEAKPSPQEEVVVQTVEVPIPVQQPVVDTPERLEVMEEPTDISVSTPVLKEENVLVLPNDGKERPASTLDQLLRTIDVLKVSPLEDETYIKFLSLKYGYHEGQFFSLGEISEILSIPAEKSREYYLQSLQFVKDWFGLQLEHYYTYLKTNGKAND